MFRIQVKPNGLGERLPAQRPGLRELEAVQLGQVGLEAVHAVTTLTLQA